MNYGRPIVGDISGEQITAWGGWITAGAGAVVYVFNAVRKSRRADRREEFGEQSAIIDRQEKRIAVLEAQVREQQDVISKLQELNAKCREESATVRAYLLAIKDELRRQGILIGPPPELHGELDEGDYWQRTTQQNVNLSVPKKPDDKPPGGDAHADSSPR